MRTIDMRISKYEGITILASNLKQNMDDAFTRRMHFIVQFPFPSARERKRIWLGIFPKKAPLSERIDWDFLAEKLEIAGGNIKNIAVSAAFYAAAARSEISMRHLIASAQREYQKMNKVVVAREFHPYETFIR
jgi:ATP-dependent 26S proteasome regulatory subunit